MCVSAIERLITALKSFDVTAAKALFGGRIGEFAKRVDLMFLIWLGLGVLTSFLLLAKLLDYLFEHQKVFVWAFFFGLILASALVLLLVLLIANAAAIFARNHFEKRRS